MKYPSIAAMAALALLLAGCETAPKTPPAPRPAATAIKPADEFEAAMLQAPVNAEALAQHSLQLSRNANAANQPAEVQRLRQRAVAFARAAQEHGTKNPMIPLLLAEINSDGTPVAQTHSSNAEADKLIHEGEAHFSRGDMDAALNCYQRALVADPTSSRAALFAGDVYFAKREFADALPWFEKAITLAPEAETPYRYRADALMRLRRYDEAGDDYINAFACAPFSPLPSQALTTWISERRLRVERPDSTFIVGGLQPQDGKFAMVLNPQNIDMISTVYVTSRAAYAVENKLDVENYRQTLAEELSALQWVINFVGEIDLNDPKNTEILQHKGKLDVLAQLDKEGLLEAHILLDRINEDLAKDYPAYLAQHREKLKTYIRRYWLKQS